MKPAKPAKSSPAPDRRRTRVVTLANVKPLTEEAHEQVRQAARDPKLAAGRRFPTLKA